MTKQRQQSILIVLIAGIGDLVLGSKGIRAIRSRFPEADIHLLTTTEASPMARSYPYLDQVWAFPARELRNRKSHIFDLLKPIRKLRNLDFNLAVNLYRVHSWQGALRMGLLFLSLRARIKVGHDHKGFGIFLDRKVPPETLRNTHFADAMMGIARAAGGIPDDKGIEVFWNPEAEAKWKHLFAGANSLRIAVNPGADHPKKRWPADRYAFVADQLIERFNGEIIVLGGPGEKRLAQEIQDKMQNDATNLAGKLTLSDLPYVISRLDLLLTNDSGPMHIGAATKTPLVALFGPEDPGLFGPYTTPDLYRVLYKGVDCRPCKNEKCERPLCLDLISPEEVLDRCVELLGSAGKEYAARSHAPMVNPLRN